MINKFVTPEIALKLKQKGFNEPCFGLYIDANDSDDDLAPFESGEFDLIYSKPRQNRINSLYNEFEVSAPTWGEAIDWFRLNYNIYIKAEPEDFINDPSKTLFSAMWFNEEWFRLDDFESFEEAREVAIKKALEII